MSGASPQTRMGPDAAEQEPRIVGLDVSKAWLDGYVPAAGRRLRVRNDATGVDELVQARGNTADCLVVMEASGGYERDRARGPGGTGCSGRDRQPETGARLRPRHGPGGQDRPGRRQADRALWRGDAPGGDACARPGAGRAARDPGLPAPADRRDRRAQAAARAAAEPSRSGRVERALVLLRQEAKELDRLLREAIRPIGHSPPTARY